MKRRSVIILIIIVLIGLTFVCCSSKTEAQFIFYKHGDEIENAANILIKEQEVLNPNGKIDKIYFLDEEIIFDGETQGKTKDLISEEAFQQVSRMFEIGILGIDISEEKISFITSGFIDNETSIVYVYDGDVGWYEYEQTKLNKPCWYISVTV